MVWVSTDTADTITIPSDLLPADGRFGSGPARIRQSQVDALNAAGRTVLGTSHRQKPVKDLVARIRAGVSELFSLPAGYEVVLGNGGSTVFWDVATFGLVRRKAVHAQFGEFGSKFAKATRTAPWLDESVIVDAAPGTSAVPTAVDGADVYAWPHNETSTGVATDIVRPAGIAEDALVVIDATSAAGGLPVDISQTDVYYFAPQKNMGSDGGLWVAIMSPRALERAREIKDSGRYIPGSLDLVTAIDNSAKDQTYNTPAVATLLLLAEQLEWINGNGGLDWATARTAESSGMIYDWARTNAHAQAFVTEPADRSAVVATVDFDDTVDAKALAAALRANGIVDVEPYRKLGRNQLRIATFVSVEPADVKALLACIDYVLERL
jgi:phosphoserine aminotransferase